VVQCVNPGGAITTATFNVSFIDGNPGIIDGSTPNALYGQLIITLASGGSGIVAGATIRVLPVRASNPTLPAFVQLPAGFFRVPDLRGRSVVGFGTESKTPGIVDPPSTTAGDSYNATQRAMGDIGGVETVTLTEAQMPSHAHPAPIQSGRSRRERDGGVGVEGYGATGYAGGSQPHPNMTPFHVLNYIIKAK